MEFGYSNP